jgi:hypothetical protein
MGLYLGLNMTLPFKQVLSSTLDNHDFVCMNKSSSHVASSTCSILDLIGYLVFARFHIFLIVCTGILSPIIFFKKETWNTGFTLPGLR